MDALPRIARFEGAQVSRLLRKIGLTARARPPTEQHVRNLEHLAEIRTRDLVARLRAKHITPHVAQNTAGRRSAIDGRTTRHVGYAISQRIRMKVEEIFGWIKTVGGFRKTRYRGLEKVDFAGYLVGAAYNLVRLARMVATPTPA